MHPDWNHIFSLGLLLAAALAGGVLAQFLRLPRVTAYLSVGVLLGPQMLHAVPESSLAFLHPLGKLAMALVLFHIGCHFTLVFLRRILSRALRFSAGELGLTFVLVSAGLLLLGESWAAAFLFAALALATAPATTILVLSENNSEGPVTEYATILVVLNNLAAVIVFELLFLIVHFLLGRLQQPFAYELLFFARDLLGSLALGAAAGLITSYCCGLLPRARWLVLLIAAATLLLGVCEALQIPYLLTFMAMGVTVANSSDHSDIRGALFDPNVDSLIRAIDLVVPTRHLLFAEESLARAWRQLQSSHDDCLPVVTAEAPHAFVGIVRQRDLFRFFAKNKSEE